MITVFALASGLYLIFLDKAGRSAAKFLLFKRAMGVAAIALGIWLFLPKGGTAAPAVPGQTAKEIVFETPNGFSGLQERLKQAKAENKQVLIDFWATWCAECKELDEKTFRDPEVAKAANNFVTLRFRLEDFNTDDAKPFVKAFGIVGLPTVVHLVPTEGAVQSARL